jgi:site-specific DNA-methyltransferase (adenine-specific)
MSRPRAYQLIEAATVATNLSTMVDIPTTERQARPLTVLDPEQQREAWQRAVETAPNGKVTAAHVQKVVNEYRAPAPVSASATTVESILVKPGRTQREPEQTPPTLPEAVTIHHADARILASLITDPVHLVITSPPYNVGIDYATHDDNMSADDYYDLLYSVFGQCWQVMEDGARIAVVVPFGVGRNPWTPVPPTIYSLLEATGFTLRGQIIWDKNTTGNRTSWGSFRLPSNPAIRDTTEAIIIAHKGDGNLNVPDSVRGVDSKGSYTAALAESDYFMELAQDHWVVAPESAQKVGHPAPFPVELAKRLIDFYAYPGAHVLDPFGGSGTTAIAAMRAGCRATLVEIDEAYCRLAKGRLTQ